jgi:hypothetical protein
MAPARSGGLNRDGAWNSARPLLGHALWLGDSRSQPATTVDKPVTGHFGQRSQESDPRPGRHRATVALIPAYRHLPTTAGWLRPNQCPTWPEQAENELTPRPLATGNDRQPSGPPYGRPPSAIARTASSPHSGARLSASHGAGCQRGCLATRQRHRRVLGNSVYSSNGEQQHRTKGRPRGRHGACGRCRTRCSRPPSPTRRRPMGGPPRRSGTVLQTPRDVSFALAPFTQVTTGPSCVRLRLAGCLRRC